MRLMVVHSYLWASLTMYLICCNFCLLQACEVELTFSTEPGQLLLFLQIQSIFEHSTLIGRSWCYPCLAWCMAGMKKDHAWFACHLYQYCHYVSLLETIYFCSLNDWQGSEVWSIWQGFIAVWSRTNNKDNQLKYSSVSLLSYSFNWLIFSG